MRMPLKLRDEFLDYLFSDEIQEFSVFFTEYNNTLKNSIMMQMYPRIFEGNCIIIKNYEDVEDVYIIRRGTVLLQTRHGVSFLSLSVNSFFGEEYVLFDELPEINFASNYDPVECFCIKKSKYLELLSQYPTTFKFVLRRAFKRNKYFKDAVMDTSSNVEFLVSRNVTFRSTNDEPLQLFDWKLTPVEEYELNDIINKKKEITSKEKICEKIKNNKKRVISIQENLEKIVNVSEDLKDHYQHYIPGLINALKLFNKGCNIEARLCLSKMNIKIEDL